MIGESGRLRKKIFKRGTLVLFVFGLGAEAGIEIVLKVRAEIDLIEWVAFRGRRFRGSRLKMLQPFFALFALEAAAYFVQSGDGLVDLLENRVFDHLRVDHLLEFELVERQHAHHLHESRREDLTLRHLEIQSWLQKRHTKARFIVRRIKEKA